MAAARQLPKWKQKQNKQTVTESIKTNNNLERSRNLLAARRDGSMCFARCDFSLARAWFAREYEWPSLVVSVCVCVWLHFADYPMPMCTPYGYGYPFFSFLCVHEIRGDASEYIEMSVKNLIFCPLDELIE